MELNWDDIKSKVIVDAYYMKQDCCEFTVSIKFKFQTQELIINARADCCGYAWIISDDDLSRLIGKSICGIKKVEPYNNPDIELYLKTHPCTNEAQEYYLYHIQTTDGLVYSFVLCGLHNGYYSPYLDFKDGDDRYWSQSLIMTKSAPRV